MSLHAQINPEAEARLVAQRRNSVITSVVIALLVMALVILVLLFILLPSLLMKSPTIVTYQAGAPEEDTMDPKEVNPQVQRKPSAPSSSTARVIASTTPSPTTHNHRTRARTFSCSYRTGEIKLIPPPP